MPIRITECNEGTYLANDKESREEVEKRAKEERIAAEAKAAEEARIAEEARRAEQERIEQEAAAQTQNNIGGMVWITETGTKYHRTNDCGKTNSAKARQITLEEAERNYEPCKKCY